jgi:Amt family ammonium transporter
MDTSLLPLAYLLPIGLLLVAWAAVPAARLRESALAAIVITVACVVAYLGFGFALQFGGIGLSSTAPTGLQGLDKAWSPFTAGAGRWTLVGLEGFFIAGDGSPTGLALIQSLALHRLPMAITAGLIPVVALGDRAHRPAIAAAGIVSTALVFPIAGAWMWGGGWLATLGINLNLGHGAIDTAGAGIIFLASASVALAALRFFGRQAEPDTSLPSARRPGFAALGAIAFGIGWSAWVASDPLLTVYSNIDFASVALLGLLGAAAAAFISAAYILLVTGRIQMLMIARGWLSGWVAVSASALFIPPGAAIGVGAAAGLMAITGQYIVQVKWSLNDRAGSVAVFGLAGAWGLIALGLFADGAFGAGWNGAAVTGGVRGLFASDPGQLTAQLAALAAISLFSIGASTLLLLPVAILTRRSAKAAAVAPEPQPVTAEDLPAG